MSIDGGDGAAITPDSPEQVLRFVATIDSDTFEVQFSDSIDSETRVVTGFTEADTESMASPGAIKLDMLTPNGETETRQLPVTVIQRVAPTTLSADFFHSDADSPDDYAEFLFRQAGIAPATVDVAKLTVYLEHDSYTPKWYALAALRLVVATKPADCVSAIPQLERLLDHGPARLHSNALYCLAEIASVAPDDVAPYMETIRDFLTTDGSARKHAIRIAMALAEDHSEALTPAVEEFVHCLDVDQSGVRSRAAYVLTNLVKADADRVEPFADSLVETLQSDGLSDSTRLNLLSAVGRLSKDDPGLAVELVPDLVRFLEQENPKLRANAAGVLADIAPLHADVLEPHTEAFVAQLEDDDDHMRINSTGILSRIAEDFPSAVRPHAERIQSLLHDDHELVRTNACWALGYLQYEPAKDVLERLSRTDSDDEVRTRAMWAIAHIEDAG